MRMQLHPGTLKGTLPAIPSKSDAHRLLICAALADAPTSIRMQDRCGEDIEATIRCLRALGASIEREERDGDDLHVTPVDVDALADAPTLDCGESGSTLRFLLPVVAALGCGGTFTGAGRLPQRPIGPLLDALRAGGASFDGDKLPLRITGALQTARYKLPGDVSSQFVTGLLLALARLPEGGIIELAQPLESAGYVDMTSAALSRFSVQVERGEQAFRVPPGSTYRSPGHATVEGDWSNMAFFLAAGALGGPIRCTGLPERSAQGDAAIVPILQRFGARVEAQGDNVTASPGGARVVGDALMFDVRAIPDLVPILAVVAAATPGETWFVGAARLRLKESDRLKTVADMLRALGGTAEEGPDFLRVVGTERLQGGCSIDSAEDHRIAMAAAIAASVCREPVLLTGAEAVDKSYPSFYADFQKLGGECRVVDHR